MRGQYINPVYIGEGAFSHVYRAWNVHTQSFVVYKEIDNLQLARREATFLQQAHHPLFTQYLDYWEEEDRGIIVMEYVAGQSLEQLLARRKSLSDKLCTEIVLELASGLFYLHACDKPIIFRDLKPAHIMIRQDGRIKLLDMGCACYEEEGKKTIAGTPAYGAPEQFQIGEPIGSYSDVYALGKVLAVMAKERKGVFRSRIFKVIDMCTKEKVEERLPDMWSLIKVLKKGAGDGVFYQKNVWKKE